MRRLTITAALAGVVVLIGRALGPKLHARLLTGCERMFERMPDDFPPKRMMRGIDEIRSNTARSLSLLEERQAAGESAQPDDGSPSQALGRT